MASGAGAVQKKKKKKKKKKITFSILKPPNKPCTQSLELTAWLLGGACLVVNLSIYMIILNLSKFLNTLKGVGYML